MLVWTCDPQIPWVHPAGLDINACRTRITDLSCPKLTSRYFFIICLKNCLISFVGLIVLLLCAVVMNFGSVVPELSKSVLNRGHSKVYSCHFNAAIIYRLPKGGQTSSRRALKGAVFYLETGLNMQRHQ